MSEKTRKKLSSEELYAFSDEMGMMIDAAKLLHHAMEHDFVSQRPCRSHILMERVVGHKGEAQTIGQEGVIQRKMEIAVGVVVSRPRVVRQPMAVAGIELQSVTAVEKPVQRQRIASTPSILYWYRSVGSRLIGLIIVSLVLGSGLQPRQ